MFVKVNVCGAALWLKKIQLLSFSNNLQKQGFSLDISLVNVSKSANWSQ